MPAALAPLAALLLLGACDDDPAPPFAIEGTGAVEGLVFLDVVEDGRFDPASGDEAVAGVQVVVRERGTTAVLAGATATTGPDGRFRIEGLPPGTHDLFFVEESVPEDVSICRNPVPVTIFVDAPTFRDVAARGACLITIAEAQAAAEGDFVIIRGIVTSSPGQTDPGFVNLEDETGGMFLFAANLEGMGIEVGDLIEVGGTVGFFSGRLQLTGVSLREHIEDVGALEPAVVTTGEIAAAGDGRDPLQNRLVSVQAAELVTGFTAGGNRNATINDGTGATIIRVEDNVADSGDAALTQLGLTVGNCYDITGIVGTFNGTAQLFPRSADDFTEVPCS